MVDDLCSKLHSATKGWDTKWYRGAKNPSHQLVPKIFRNIDHANREGYLAVEFRRRAHARLKEISTPFDWLCAMQHFGIPTRILDWTESLPVALYFAVRPLGFMEIVPTVWVLDPFRLYAESFKKAKKEIIPIPEFDSVEANCDLAFDEWDGKLLKNATELPLPVAPNFIFERLALQNGAFTLHGKSQLALEKLLDQAGEPMLYKFVARETALTEIYRSLDLLIPSDDAVFPDLEGLKEQIV